MPTTRRLALVAFVLTAALAALGAGVQATGGGRLTADEPQYLLTAISLAEDGDLDISDELAEERWRDFHRADLPRQTEPRPDGSELSPHDPLLPALLVPGVVVGEAVGVGAWVGARVVMALIAGALAAVLVATATRTLGATSRAGLAGVLSVTLGAPIAAYGSQLYPELPAALAVAVGVDALLRLPGPATIAARWIAVVVALPWLGVKYVPVAAAVALLGLALDRPRRRPAFLALAASGAAYAVLHQRIYGGWTVYAAGDHFTAGELTVVGEDPNLLGRSIRLLGLLVDRDFGLAVWAPVFLVAVVAVAHVAGRSGRRSWVLLLPLAAGWATATWVALTMHGWWWPGRQVVVVVPVLALALVVFLDERPRWVPAVVTLGALGAAAWAWVAVESTWGDLRLIVDFADTGNPWVRMWRLAFPDERADSTATAVLNVSWGAGLVAAWLVAWRSARRDEDAVAGERADADHVPADLDRGRPVG